MPVARPTIIAFSMDPWEEPQWMNRQQILSRLASRGWPVIYSTGALDISSRHKNEWRTSGLISTVSVVDGVRVFRSGRLSAGWKRSRRYDKFVINAHLRGILREAAKIGSPSHIQIIFHPKFWPYVRNTQNSRVVFHAYDVYQQQGPHWRWNDEKQNDLVSLLDRADLVTASSDGISDYLKAQFRRDIRVLPNGADFDYFYSARSSPCPADLALVPHPRIAYVGSVNRKVDLPLIREISIAQPQWHWCIVGPIADDAINTEPEVKAAFEFCQRANNVHFFGERNRFETAHYVAHCDVNTMIYRTGVEGWWNDGYPLKLHEYLAVGKPVVSADLPAIRPFRSVVHITHGVDGWISAISNAIKSGGMGTVAERIAVAGRNSWDSRVTVLEEWLSEL